MECYWKHCTQPGIRAFRDVHLHDDDKYIGEVYLCGLHLHYARRHQRLLLKDEILAQRLIHIKMRSQ